MEPHFLDGKMMGAFLIKEVPGGEDEFGAVEGIAKWDGRNLWIVTTSGGAKPFLIPSSAHINITPIDERFRLVFEHAEFYVPLIVAPLAEGADVSGMMNTGHVWPMPTDD